MNWFVQSMWIIQYELKKSRKVSLGIFQSDDWLLWTVLNGVRFVTIFVADWALVQAQFRTYDRAIRIFDGVWLEDHFRSAVVLAEYAMLKDSFWNAERLQLYRSPYIHQRSFIRLEFLLKLIPSSAPALRCSCVHLSWHLSSDHLSCRWSKIYQISRTMNLILRWAILSRRYRRWTYAWSETSIQIRWSTVQVKILANLIVIRSILFLQYQGTRWRIWNDIRLRLCRKDLKWKLTNKFKIRKSRQTISLWLEATQQWVG